MRVADYVAGCLLTLLLVVDVRAAEAETRVVVARAVEAEPRVVVASVAKAIEDNYFDASRGKRIADDLRNDVEAGRFDAQKDPRDLATALTARLSPLDSHFSVRWSASGTPPPPVHAMRMRMREAPSNTTGTAKVSTSGQPAHSVAHGATRPGSPRLVRRAHPGVDVAAQRTNFGIRQVEVWPGNVGYIDLRMFANFAFGDPDAPARRAIEAALQLVAHADALIIDLRLNGGGSPAMVGYLTSAYTPKGADIYNTFHSRQGTGSEAPLDWYPNPRLDVPLFLLTSARTGSAAEAFAYTLKNAKRATIVGEATGGAANPGGFIDAGDGFTVFVSDGSPISPITGRNWEGTGVAPDVVVTAEHALDKGHELALAAILERVAPGTDATDTRWAQETLRARTSPTASEPLAQYIGEYDAVAVGEQDGRLFLRRGRRPPLLLQPLGKGVFSVEVDSNQRLRFDRDAQGRIVALEALSADGNSSRYLRKPDLR